MTRLARIAIGALLATALLATAAVGEASASKQVIAYFGSESGTAPRGGEFQFPGEIAVNSTGAGPANRGDIYVADTTFGGGTRIQRFAQDDNGTPADPYDDTYRFVSAWGADVDSTPSGGSDYEICTEAADCKSAVPSAGNGTTAGDGVMRFVTGVAVDQETGDVYVSDGGQQGSNNPNSRVNVYEGDGTFLRSFGWDVVASGPDDTGTGFEVCVAANGDVCKAGSGGSGLGQIKWGEGIALSPPDGLPGTGSVYLADPENRRVDTYALDGSPLGSFDPGFPSPANPFAPAPGPFEVAVDSRGIVYTTGRNVAGTAIEIHRYDTENADGGGVGTLAPISAPPLLIGGNNVIAGLEVDPDSDGAGPDKDVLYVLRNLGPEHTSVIQQFGPVNAPGLATPPAADDDEHGGLIGFSFVESLGFDEASGRLFVGVANGNFQRPVAVDRNKAGVYVLDVAGGPPSGNLESISDITPFSATLHGTVDPNGGPPVSYRIEYSTDGATWSAGAPITVGTQETPQSIEPVLDPPGTGLQPSTLYHVRLRITKAFTLPVVTAEQTFTTLPAGPGVETVGSPLREATTARLEGRVNPRGAATTYHFEYGDQGPCDANPCQATAPLAAGAGSQIEFVSQEVLGLTPETTYHYRLVADNGLLNDGGDMTFTTRSASPLSHGHFPGPPGSDRAWEQVNTPDTGGNPVLGGAPFSDDGERAVYQIAGGAPISESGSGFNEFFAQRTPQGWESKKVLPARSEVFGGSWLPPSANGDLSEMVAVGGGDTATNRISLFRLRPGGASTKLFDTTGGFFRAIVSADASRVVVAKQEGLDPEHPVVPPPPNESRYHLYDLSDGTPHLVDLLPDGTVPLCGVVTDAFGFSGNSVRLTTHWLSADGSLLFFPSRNESCSGPAQLYVRDLDAGQTKRVSIPPLSGLDCGAGFIKSTPQYAFFWTQSRLDAVDTNPPACGGEHVDGDVYRYDLSSGAVECVTCVVSGLDAEVFGPTTDISGGSQIAVAEDGSRLYFKSAAQLLPGAAAPAIYRVDVATGDLAYVAPVGTSLVNANYVGDDLRRGNALNADGSVLIFRSAIAGLDQLNGAHNGGTLQYYRYDDRDRSLTCVSCPPDGSPAPLPASGVLTQQGIAEEQGPNTDPLDGDGETFIFTTPNPLVRADLNTAKPGGDPASGLDLYEWRDGRILLVSDGLTSWPEAAVAPTPNGISQSGRDVFFTASAQYTPDALDGYNRLYDARIGGGIDTPPPPRPCPLEVCQGTPKGAPEEPAPGSMSFSGSGNVLVPAPRKHRQKHKKKHHRRKHNRHHTTHHRRAQG
jgi:hypothetical protein